MCRYALIFVVIGSVIALTRGADGGDWIFDKSTYTNDPTSGQRVDQYQAVKPVYRIPYSKYFSPDGPHPYIPDSYYQYEGGLPGGAYASGYGFYPHSYPYAYVGPYRY